jgi:PPOX class probable F420-dependent enzyme
MEIGVAVPPGQPGAFSVGERSEASGLDAIPETHRMLLTGPITATLATINRSGTVQLTPVWVGSDDTHVLLNTAKGRVKDRNMRERPDVTLLFMNPENPYHWMSIRGVIEEAIDEDDPERGHLVTEDIDNAAELYVNQRPYPFRDPVNPDVRVLFRVRPVKVQVFGAP